MTPSLWVNIAVYASTAVIIAAVMFGYEGRNRTAIALGVVGGVVFVGALTLQALGVA